MSLPVRYWRSIFIPDPQSPRGAMQSTTASAPNSPTGPLECWRETSKRRHQPAEQLLTGGRGCPWTWVLPQGEVTHGQPLLHVHLGAHLLQLLACTGHSNWVGAPEPSTPRQKLPMFIVVRAILLLWGSTTWGTSPHPLSCSMKVSQSSKAASP